MVKKKTKKKKKKLKSNSSDVLIIIIIIAIIGAILLLSKCESLNFIEEETDGNDSSSGNDNGVPGEEEGDEPVEDITLCTDILLEGFGDHSATCSLGGCTNTLLSCDHYWNYDEQLHECACTETYYCGQYCYEYFFDLSDAQNNCECPPNSIKEIITRSSYQCVPNNHFCEDGQVMDEVGPFPE